MPSTITYIDGNAFANCGKLQDIKVNAMIPPRVSYGAFNGVPTSTCTIHVPIGTLAQYKDADGWMDFANIVEDIASGIENPEISMNSSFEIYTIDGMKINTLQKGINIIKMSNGTTRKVVIK